MASDASYLLVPAPSLLARPAVAPAAAATPVEGQQIPKVLLGFNNWKVKLDPKEMKHSSIQVRVAPNHHLVWN
jgi:hypothetical protein